MTFKFSIKPILTYVAPTWAHSRKSGSFSRESWVKFWWFLRVPGTSAMRKLPHRYLTHSDIVDTFQTFILETSQIFKTPSRCYQTERKQFAKKTIREDADSFSNWHLHIFWNPYSSLSSTSEYAQHDMPFRQLNSRKSSWWCQRFESKGTLIFGGKFLLRGLFLDVDIFFGANPVSGS